MERDVPNINRALTKLDLRYNEIDYAGKQAIRAAWKAKEGGTPYLLTL